MIVLVIIGSLIGAGFASGQEIYVFFYRYGKNGIIGLVICSILIGMVIYKTLKISVENKIKSYKEFLEYVFKPKKQYLNLSYIYNIIVNIFMLITFFIMISGFGAYFEQEYEISKQIGALVLAIISFLTFMTSVKGVTKANEIAVPILITVIILLGFKSFSMIDFIDFGSNLKKQMPIFLGLAQSIIYSCYNSILLLPILVNISSYINDKKEIKQISIISGILIFVLALSIFLVLVNIDIDISKIEMPVVYAVNKIMPKLKKVYGVIILLSIFTTSISVGISFLKNVSQNEKSFPHIAIIMCITGVLISNFGFSNLVKVLFPTFGFLGIIQIYFLLLQNSK